MTPGERIARIKQVVARRYYREDTPAQARTRRLPVQCPCVITTDGLLHCEPLDGHACPHTGYRRPGPF